MYQELKDFPSIGWVKKLNENRRFSGSVGTAGSGTFSVYTFHYYVWTKEESDEEGNKKKILCVSCHVKPPINSGKEISEAAQTEYALSEETLGLAKAWILEQLNSHDCIGQS